MTRRSLVSLLFLIPTFVFAHGNEEHGTDVAPPVVGEVAPRAEAQSELFEAVVTPQHGRLTIYLDRSATNEPVSDARIEVESGTWKAVADVAESGTYRVDAAPFAQPGDYPIMLTVTTGDEADLLETTLVVKPVAPAMGASGSSLPIWSWVVGALAALGVGAGVLVKRRRSAR